jgi:chromosome segregation ATPase
VSEGAAKKNENVTNNASASSYHNQVKVDSRTIAADGSVKQAHFGPDQYLADVHSYQYLVYERVQNSVKQADQCLSDMLNDIRGEMELVKIERAKLRDFITAIKSNIRTSDPQKMNSKDRNIVRKLSHIDERLETLENNHQEINEHYKETMVKLKKYMVDLSDDTVEVLTAPPV